MKTLFLKVHIVSKKSVILQFSRFLWYKKNWTLRFFWTERLEIFSEPNINTKDTLYMYLITKSYVVQKVADILIRIFRDSRMRFWAKLNLQTFRYVPNGKVYQKFFGAHPAFLRLQTPKMKPNFIFLELFSKIYEKGVKFLWKFVEIFLKCAKVIKETFFTIWEMYIVPEGDYVTSKCSTLMEKP